MCKLLCFVLLNQLLTLSTWIVSGVSASLKKKTWSHVGWAAAVSGTNDASPVPKAQPA